MYCVPMNNCTRIKLKKQLKIQFTKTFDFLIATYYKLIYKQNNFYTIFQKNVARTIQL